VRRITGFLAGLVEDNAPAYLAVVEGQHLSPPRVGGQRAGFGADAYCS
jgi:hypothetical protein